MTEQVQQNKTKAERVREAETHPEEHGRTDEQTELLETTDDLLAEIDDLLPELVVELEYIDNKTKALHKHLTFRDVAYELVFNTEGVVIRIDFDSFCIC